MIAVLGSPHRTPIDLVEGEPAVIRTALAAIVVAAGILGLGADLVHTAYGAAHTARVVVLPPASA